MNIWFIQEKNPQKKGLGIYGIEHVESIYPFHEINFIASGFLTRKDARKILKTLKLQNLNNKYYIIKKEI